MKYLLIDGNNLAIRCSFANSELQSGDGVPTGVHYGVFQSLINIKQQYPEHKIAIIWDGKSERRVAEAKTAVENGLIKSGYKENRPKDDLPQPLRDFYSQALHLKKGIEQAGIPQIRLNNYETDDLIAAYCKNLKGENEIVCVTNDKDYYQLLDDNVCMSKWSGGEETVITKESFVAENGIQPHQHVDCGALSGDTGDNIFGIPSWGDKTALKAIQQLGTWQNVLDKYKGEISSHREKYPDLKDNPKEFNRLQGIQTDSGKPKYPEITINMPYTGVALAVEDKKIKAIKKSVLLALMHEERVALAYSLKKMDDEIAGLPEITEGNVNKENLIQYFDYFDIESLKPDIDIFE